MSRGKLRPMGNEDRMVYGGSVIGLVLMWLLSGYANAKLTEPVYNAFGDAVGTNNSLWWTLMLCASLFVAFVGTLVLIGTYFTDFVVPRVSAYRYRKTIDRAVRSSYVDAEH